MLLLSVEYSAKEGVGLNESDLRILILYTVSAAGRGISPEDVCDLVATDKLGHLNVRESFEKLREEKLLTVLEDGGVGYTYISDEGKLIVEQLQGNLSISLRKDIAKRAVGIMEKLRGELDVTAFYEESRSVHGGFDVNLGLSDRGEKLFTLTLYAPTAIQADMMVKNFKSNPASVYSGLINLVTEQRD